MATEEIEVNFRLDGEGRTASTKDNNTETFTQSTIDYQFKTTSSRFVVGNASSSPFPDALLDELLYDCEIADSGLMPRTFWVPATGFKPRFSLEQMAMDVFQNHVKDDTNYNPDTSGAEWWVQIRPSPEKTGRYSMHDDDASDEKDMSKQGISFHWDKDEDLRLLCGGNTYVHPHLSTVTYLTDLGAPTLAMNCRIHNLTGEWIVPENEQEAFISWPKTGKHLSFDGRFLHAAPVDLMEDGQFESQCKFKAKDETEHKKLQRRHRRVTFLSNIWLNYHPFDVKPFPDTMIEKMSGHKDDRVHLILEKEPDFVRRVTIQDGVLADGPSDEKNEIHQFEFPMGDCGSGECIKVLIPLCVVREQTKGNNLKIRWQSSCDSSEPGIRLCRTEKTVELGTKRPRLEGSPN